MVSLATVSSTLMSPTPYRSTIGLLLLTVASWQLPVNGVPVRVRRNATPTVGVDLLMPDVQPQAVETYLCHAMKMKKDPTFIVGFQPHASMMYAHHVLIYGCVEPGDEKPAWDCGEMHATGSSYESGPVCKTGSKIIYAWAMDAPELNLPEGVGFKVGGDTDIQYLVLQVHYKDVTPFVAPKNGTDHSGVTLMTTDQPQPKRAGVYLMGTDGQIPPHSVTYMETACSYNEPFTMYPFAFRTHAHIHGRVVSGYRIRDGKWLEIGRMSPQKPQMFYNVTTPGIAIQSGDILAARCTMVNDENRTVSVGSTGNDEMCNFYVMYYVNGDRTIDDGFCFSAGPPNWSWDDFNEGDSWINAALAPLSASVVPGTDDFLAATSRKIADRQRAMLEDESRLAQLMEAIGGDTAEEASRMLMEDENEADRPINEVIRSNYIYDDMYNE